MAIHASLLRTPNPGTTTFMLLITVRVVGLPSSVSTLPPFGVVVLEVDLFNMFPGLSSPLHLRVGLGFAIWAGKRVMQQLDLIGSDGGGEDDVEFKDQEALVKWPLVRGHSFSGNLFHVAWLDDLLWLRLEEQETAIEMSHGQGETGEGLKETDVEFHHQIRLVAATASTAAATLEARVRLHLQDEQHVAVGVVGELIAFTAESDLLIVAHALVHVHLDHLGLLHHLLALALAAAISRLDDLPLSTTLGANVLLVRHQPWRELHDAYADAPSATRVALGPTSLALGASPLAEVAEDLSLEGSVEGLAVVEVLESDL